MAILFFSGIFVNYASSQSSSQEYVKDRLLVKFKDHIQENQKQGILSQNNAIKTDEISQIDVLIITVPEAALSHVENALSKNPAIEYVERDWILEPSIIPNDSLYSNQWYLSKIGVDKAWDVTRGNSAPIAILDTGIDSAHADLSAKLLPGWNYYDNNSDLTDICGHGTKVAGTAAAITNNTLGVAGVAWNNPIIPIKITDPQCYGYYSTMTKGITFAADNGAKAANISFQVYNGAAFTSAAQYMHSKGGWVVVAGGNTGIYENYSDNPYVISVSSTTSSDVASSFSSFGPYIDFTAPGSSIYTTKTGGGYAYASGTSFASPIMAGAIALVFASDSSLTPDDVYVKLKNSAVDLGSSGRDDYYGWGRIDIGKALEQPTPIVDTITPSVTITSPTDNTNVLGTITINVDASDNNSVSDVTLYIDNSYYSVDASFPYSFTIDTFTLSLGNHVVRTTATDPSGNSSYDEIIINVISDTVLPSVQITSPSDGQVISNSFDVLVDASDNMQITRIEFYVDDVLKGQDSISPYSISLNPSDIGSGTHQIKAKAVDGNNNTAEDTISITVLVDTVSPSVNITSPLDGKVVSGKTLILVSAFDSSGISHIEIRVDGTLLTTLTTSPYEYMWNTRSLSSGTHTVLVKAFDMYGNSATDSIYVISEKGGKPQSK